MTPGFRSSLRAVERLRTGLGAHSIVAWNNHRVAIRDSDAGCRQSCAGPKEGSALVALGFAVQLRPPNGTAKLVDLGSETGRIAALVDHVFGGNHAAGEQ